MLAQFDFISIKFKMEDQRHTSFVWNTNIVCVHNFSWLVHFDRRSTQSPDSFFFSFVYLNLILVQPKHFASSRERTDVFTVTVIGIIGIRMNTFGDFEHSRVFLLSVKIRKNYFHDECRKICSQRYHACASLVTSIFWNFQSHCCCLFIAKRKWIYSRRHLQYQ